MAKWIGYAVSVNCGEPLGCYQGTILEADGSTITLTKAFRNGFPYPKSQVTLNAADIKELKIIESRAEPAEQTHSTVAVSKASKKGPRATVCENLQANPSSSGNQGPPVSGSSSKGATSRPGPTQPPARSKPIDIQSKNNKNNTHAGSYGNSGSGRADKARRRNEACFGGDAAAALDDFDFEGNLALFDKRALWEQMRHSHKPDLLRQADEMGGKFRHDENVLGGTATARRSIRVPDALRGPLDYVTDDGLVVPSLTGAARRRLWELVWRAGMGPSAATLLARACADVALRLAGGGRRLDPSNAHQTPVVVALAGVNNVGAVGATAARILAAHGARAALWSRDVHAHAHAHAAGVSVLASLDLLPSPDVVLLALHDDQDQDTEESPAVSAALRWARGARAALVALEPRGAGCGVPCRAAVSALLPPALAPELGRVYLANVAPPLAAFAELRIAYRPPFGASAVLALHAADAADCVD
ncbi:enhancer of mRNA-decapping protein 3 isoform X1 [Plodia interpunctella]|uniref:enhancer of mRNA-decapping protein 3 isoform X1 n=1 Tax=Plodia interpunctella TaxID=58824 RepID=UPI002368E151|nr:enhancer of mRNA-decapping protein 3 isoform X1 [Plodia interpunctella]